MQVALLLAVTEGKLDDLDETSLERFKRELGGYLESQCPQLVARIERERRILTERRLREEPVTLEDLSKVYDVSRERIRQIEVRAFEKLQKAIRNAAIEEQLAAN